MSAAADVEEEEEQQPHPDQLFNIKLRWDTLITIAAIYAHDIDNNIELVDKRMQQDPNEIDRMINILIRRFLDKKS